MTVSEIEKLVLTNEEAAAISAAVTSVANDLMMALFAGDDDTPEMSKEILNYLLSGESKVMKLNRELTKGIREERENG